jgi:adenylate kinase family enzyme
LKPLAIHITGASGAGVSTLGRALAERTGATHLDTDDFFWLPIEPRFSQERPVAERLRLIESAMDAAGVPGWILSGSIGNWGEPLLRRVSLVVFVRTATAVRLERLEERERVRFGTAIDRGGARHAHHKRFIQWASDYDTGTKEGRSLALHEAFLARLSCPVLRVDGTEPTEALVDKVMHAISSMRPSQFSTCQP